jgi:hypothetical protein
MNITAEKSFLIDLLQNSTDGALIEKVKRFVLKEMDSIMNPNEVKDYSIMESGTNLNNVESESPLEVQKIIEVWTDYTQYFRSAPKLDSK